ncbi:MAG: hypothetical protein JNK49_21940 [Planctomycetes bacterium]|nr:hypothetical protein [Planctomycetota bacterium]
MALLPTSQFSRPGALALTLALAACASGPSAPRITEGQRTVVRYVQFEPERMLILQNRSSGQPKDVYSDRLAEPGTKVVDDAILQQLIDKMAEHGMFVRNERSVATAARDALIVEQGDRRVAWSRLYRQGEDPAEQPFFVCRQAFLDDYNAATAMQTPRERPDLRAEQERAQQDAAAAQRKLLELQRGGR